MPRRANKSRASRKKLPGKLESLKSVQSKHSLRGELAGCVSPECPQEKRALPDLTKGEAGDKEAAPQLAPNDAIVFHDVIADEHGQPMLVPIDGPADKGLYVEEFPPDALVAVRTFRFFEDRADETKVWEQKLQNLNSGSLLWLPVHMTPGMHSKSGAKYGKWFTVHYLQVMAKHFKDPYHMCNEGFTSAKSFGSAVEKRLLQGETLDAGYFWFVSPAEASAVASQRGQLGSWGWKHLAREGPFDGTKFVGEWQKHGSPMATQNLQVVLDEMRFHK